MEAAFEGLQWDSELFGFPVARLKPEGLLPSTISAALKILESSGFRLAYGSVPWSDIEGRQAAEAARGLCVDRKTIFIREFTPRPRTNPRNVLAFRRPEPTPELEALALASGQHSRFRTDPGIGTDVFRRLYLTWIRRSVRREIADEVLVAIEEGAPAGMVTLALRGSTAEIGLIAVDEAHRGKGLGRMLMEASEVWAGEQGVRRLRVVTQGANEVACSLYKRCQYTVQSEEAFFHFWIGQSVEEATR